MKSNSSKLESQVSWQGTETSHQKRWNSEVTSLKTNLSYLAEIIF